MLRAGATGFGWLAFSALARDPAFGGSITPPGPHFPAKARSVIFLFMDGGVSHVDTFDPKPKLAEQEGKPWSGDPSRKWVKSPGSSPGHGEGGTWISEAVPPRRDPRRRDRRRPLDGRPSCRSTLPASCCSTPGTTSRARPSLGSWVSYGLGSENQNLPGYVVLSFGHVPVGGLEAFGSGFLPASHEATIFKADGVPLENLKAADPEAIQRAKLALMREQDAEFASRGGGEAVEGAIRNGEVAAPDAIPRPRRPGRVPREQGDPRPLRPGRPRPQYEALRPAVPPGPPTGGVGASVSSR